MSTSQSDRTLGLDQDPVDREALSLPGAEEQIELLLVSGKVAASQHAQETATHDHCARRPRRTVSREASWRQMYQTRLLQRASADTDSDAGEPHYTKPWRVPLPSRPPPTRSTNILSMLKHRTGEDFSWRQRPNAPLTRMELASHTAFCFDSDASKKSGAIQVVHYTDAPAERCRLGGSQSTSYPPDPVKRVSICPSLKLTDV